MIFFKVVHFYFLTALSSLLLEMILWRSMGRKKAFTHICSVNILLFSSPFLYWLVVTWGFTTSTTIMLNFTAYDAILATYLDWKYTTLAKIYLLKVNNRNTRKRCEICSKLTVKIPERRHWRHSAVFTVNFAHISHLFRKFLSLTLNK